VFSLANQRIGEEREVASPSLENARVTQRNWYQRPKPQ
jgi:hypothetical protein